MEALELAVGLLFLALVFWDVFQTIVVPRPTPGRFRLGRYLIRGAWRAARGTVGAEVGATRDRLLGLFAPAATVLLLVAWLSGLIFGYGLILFALRAELQPAPGDLGTALYFAASSILTLGFGDIVAIGSPARIVVVAAAASGLGIVALVVTFLFSLFGSYQRREVSVVTLEARAGVPPSAVVLLESLARMDLVAQLPEFFGEWERWAAEVLDSHVAYPLLGYFRSSHDNLSWISALGTVLDAASLVLTTTEGVPRGEAELFARVGSHLVEDISNLNSRAGVTAPRDPARVGSGLDRAAFDKACLRLAEAGYRVAPADQAWQAFELARTAYAPRLESIAAYWATPTNSWLDPAATLRSAAHSPAESNDRVGYPPA